MGACAQARGVPPSGCWWMGMRLHVRLARALRRASSRMTQSQLGRGWCEAPPPPALASSAALCRTVPYVTSRTPERPATTLRAEDLRRATALNGSPRAAIGTTLPCCAAVLPAEQVRRPTCSGVCLRRGARSCAGRTRPAPSPSVPAASWAPRSAPSCAVPVHSKGQNCDVSRPQPERWTASHLASLLANSPARKAQHSIVCTAGLRQQAHAAPTLQQRGAAGLHLAQAHVIRQAPAGAARVQAPEPLHALHLVGKQPRTDAGRQAVLPLGAEREARRPCKAGAQGWRML